MLFELGHESLAADRGVFIREDSPMPQVERNVLDRLRSEKNGFPEGMSNPYFIEHVRILSSEVGDHEVGPRR